MTFNDRYGTPWSLQASSLAEYKEPGTSAVWLGVDVVEPKLARMHLDRSQVRTLIKQLQSWLKTGGF